MLHRGAAYWTDEEDKRILIATNDAYLIALDAKTGRLCEDFGERGRVDLTQGLRRPVSHERVRYGMNSPPVICGDVAVVGSSVQDAPMKK